MWRSFLIVIMTKVVSSMPEIPVSVPSYKHHKYCMLDSMNFGKVKSTARCVHYVQILTKIVVLYDVWPVRNGGRAMMPTPKAQLQN